MTKSKSDGEATAPRVTKASLLLDLLRRENGATLAELVGTPPAGCRTPHERR